MMQFTTPTGKYHVTSHGNGWAYEITCQETGESIHFQDHDADHIFVITDELRDEAAIDDLFFIHCD